SACGITPADEKAASRLPSLKRIEDRSMSSAFPRHVAREGLRSPKVLAVRKKQERPESVRVCAARKHPAVEKRNGAVICMVIGEIANDGFVDHRVPIAWRRFARRIRDRGINHLVPRSYVRVAGIELQFPQVSVRGPDGGVRNATEHDQPLLS